MTKLTNKQEAFAQHYALHGNACEAYRQAYDASRMKATSIECNSCKLLKSAKVAQRVAELQAVKARRMAERFDITVDRIAQELAAIAFADPTDYFTWGVRTVTKYRGKNQSYEVEEPYVALKPMEELSKVQRKAIVGAEMSYSQSGHAIAHIKLADKRGALNDLGKHLGMFNADKSQRPEVNVTVTHDAVFEELSRQLGGDTRSALTH